VTSLVQSAPTMTAKAAVSILLTFACVIANAVEATGRVVAIADGDTVTVLYSDNHQENIRLAGIDAPEKRQPFGQRSKQNLSTMAFNREVHLDGDKKDRYGRRIAKLIVSGKDVGLEQIRSGMAWHYKKYAREQSPTDRDAYAQAEQSASDRRVGLWADANPTPPWEWRLRR